MKILPYTLGGLLLVLTFLTSSTPRNFQKAFLFPPEGYVERLEAYGFAGMPMREIHAKIAALVPQGQALAYGAALDRDDYLRQRFAEALYPLRIEANAGFSLDVGAPRGLPGEHVLALLRPFGNIPLVLTGISATPEETPRPSPTMVAFADAGPLLSLVPFLLASLSALGWGAIGYRFFFRGANLPAAAALSAQLVSGAVTLGLLATAATWLQFRLPWTRLLGIGVAALAGHAWLSRGVFRLDKFRPARLPLETWLFAAALLLFLARVWVFPVTLWDGRSIWLFTAKKVFYSGMLPLADLKNPMYLFSHSIYPLLVPSWLAFFSSSLDQFSERVSAMSLALLFSALLCLAWGMSRSVFGRAAGAVFCFFLLAISENLVGGGYVDSLLVLGVVLPALFLGGAATGLRPVTFFLAFASLVKFEGLFLGAAAALSLTLFQYRFRDLIATGAAFLPAVAHQLWVRLQNIPNSYENRGRGIEDLLGRAVQFLAEHPAFLQDRGYLNVRYFFPEAVAFAAAAALAGWFLKRTGDGAAPRARRLWITGIILLVLAAGIPILMVHPMAYSIVGYERYAMSGYSLLVLAGCSALFTRHRSVPR